MNNRGFADRDRKEHSHHGGARAMTIKQLRVHCERYGYLYLTAAQIKTAEMRRFRKA